MDCIDLVYFTGGEIKLEYPKLEQWKLDLVKLISKAHKEDKLLQCTYDMLVFTPKGLAANLIQGRFVWGVVNWKLIDKNSVKKIDYNDEYYDKIIEKLQKLRGKHA